MIEIGAFKETHQQLCKNRKVYEEYRRAGYSKRFFEEHREEILLHKAAKAAFNQRKGKKVPSRKALDEEFHQLLTEKKRHTRNIARTKKKCRSI